MVAQPAPHQVPNSGKSDNAGLSWLTSIMVVMSIFSPLIPILGLILCIPLSIGAFVLCIILIAKGSPVSGVLSLLMLLVLTPIMWLIGWPWAAAILGN